MNDRFLFVAAALMLIPGCPTNTMQTDAASPSDAASFPDAPPARPEREDPFEIGASQQARSGALQRNLAALFSENPCNTAWVGPCVLTTCPTPPNDGGLPPNTHVGTITVSGGQLTAPMLLEPNPTTGAYRGMFNVNGALFAPGDTVTFETALGSTSTNLTAPSTIAVTAPVLTDSMVINRGSDLVFTWTSADAAPVGDVVVSGVSFGSAPGAQSMACSFPVSAGTGMVPAAAFQAFRVGSANIGVSTQSAAVIDAAGIRTRIELTNNVGGAAGVNVRVE